MCDSEINSCGSLLQRTWQPYVYIHVEIVDFQVINSLIDFGIQVLGKPMPHCFSRKLPSDCGCGSVVFQL